MERVVVKHASFEAAQKADRDFYRRLTPQQRIEILLELIERERERLGPAGQEFVRVCRIVKFADSRP
jgi:hypothetical protein